MFTSVAHVRTPNASRYLVQLSERWSHRFPDMACNALQADVPLPGGPLVLRAEDGALHLQVQSAARESLLRMQDVVTGHLQRFACEPLEVCWRAD